MNYQPTPPAPEGIPNMGQPAARYGGEAKVTGQPLYAADTALQRPLYAALVTSRIALGEITAIDARAASRVTGVARVFTYKDDLGRSAPAQSVNYGTVSDSRMPLAGTHIAYAGEIVAVTVAESQEAADEAARLVEVTVQAQTPSATFGDPGLTTDAVGATPKNRDVGDVTHAFATSPVQTDHRYATATQHHNPMELYATIAVWHGDELTLYEPSQFVYGLRADVATALGVDQGKVTVINPFVGGAFGGKGLMTQRTALICAIARIMKRPVRLVCTRAQGFTASTFRAETQHHVRLAANHDGKLTGYFHEGWEITSRADNYFVGGVQQTSEMYAWPAVRTRVNMVRADRSTPGFMRAPAETPYMYALESAMDEMAVALNMDPIEFRRLNDTKVSPVNGAPYSSRSLMTCYDAAAASFGWRHRQPGVGSMRDGDWLIGYGCATATYPTDMLPAAARVRLTPDGHALVQIAAHDVGQGSYSVMQQVAAEALNLPIPAVTVQMGSTTLPPGPVAGGSMTTGSAGSAVLLACNKVAARFGNRMPAAAELNAAFQHINAGAIEEYAEYLPEGDEHGAIARLYRGKQSPPRGGDDGKPLKFAFGANFVEVRVHRLTREVRVPRMTGAFAAGRIVNPRTARSQYMGGMIWGMEMALLEATEIDRRRARYTNENLADYLIAVNPDVPRVDILMIPEIDHQVNPLGTKGIGELANVGMPAAVANAVYHATGKRIRDLPITIDKLIMA